MAEAIYASAPTEAEMAVLGLTEEDFEDEIIEVWPENLPAYELFNALSSQWRFRPNGMGPGIPVGLEYLAIPTVLRLQGVPRSEWRYLFDDLKVMEQQALQVMWEE